MAQNNYKLVYSSEGSQKDLRKKSDGKSGSCGRDQAIVPEETLIKIRVEKKGRGGKSVSVLFELPQNDKYWKDIAKKLKAHCGTGGSFKDGRIEIQGDQREKLKTFLEKMNFKVKLAGG